VASAEENRLRAREWGLAELWSLWRQIREKQVKDWDVGKALEHLIIRAFELEGARVEYPFEVLSPFYVRSEDDSRTRAPTR